LENPKPPPLLPHAAASFWRFAASFRARCRLLFSFDFRLRSPSSSFARSFAGTYFSLWQWRRPVFVEVAVAVAGLDGVGRSAH
jgi:hypothetical protein